MSGTPTNDNSETFSRRARIEDFLHGNDTCDNYKNNNSY